MRKEAIERKMLMLDGLNHFAKPDVEVSDNDLLKHILQVLTLIWSDTPYIDKYEEDKEDEK